MSTLDDLIHVQRQLQEQLGYDFDTMSDEHRVKYIRDMVLALTHEAHELLDTVQWKPWVTAYRGDAIDGVEFEKELADIFTFLLNLALVAGISGNALEYAYDQKNRINQRRASSNYDGNWALKRSTVDGEPDTMPV